LSRRGRDSQVRRVRREEHWLDVTTLQKVRRKTFLIFVNY
jgi:hypothetical protein